MKLENRPLSLGLFSRFGGSSFATRSFLLRFHLSDFISHLDATQNDECNRNLVVVTEEDDEQYVLQTLLLSIFISHLDMQQNFHRNPVTVLGEDDEQYFW